MMGIPALVVNVLCGLRQIIGRVGKTAYNNSEDVVAKGYVTAHLYIKMLNRKTIYFLQMETKKVTSNRIAYFVLAFFFAYILVLSSIVGQITNATVTADPGTYMTGQHIATSEEMGIDSLLTRYENNSFDPAVLINDIYDRIELNNAIENNPILIYRVSRS